MKASDKARWRGIWVLIISEALAVVSRVGGDKLIFMIHESAFQHEINPYGIHLMTASSSICTYETKLNLIQKVQFVRLDCYSSKRWYSVVCSVVRSASFILLFQTNFCQTNIRLNELNIISGGEQWISVRQTPII